MYQCGEKNGALMMASAEHHEEGGKKLLDNNDDEALISAVFESIRLPEVRFAPSPPGAVIIEDAATARSTPNSLTTTTPAPPNSMRTTTTKGPTIAENDQALKLQQRQKSPTAPPPPRRSVRGRQQTPRDVSAADLYADYEGDGDDDNEEDEQYSMHLIAHKDSLEFGSIIVVPPTEPLTTADGNWVPDEDNVSRLSSQMSFSADGLMTPLGTLDTQETGEATLDTARSMVATPGGTSDNYCSSAAELEQYAEDGGDDCGDGDNDGGDSVIVHRRCSSGLSTEIVNDAMANAIRNVSRASKASATTAEGQQPPMGDEQPKMRHGREFQLELDKRVSAHRLSSGSSSSASGAAAGRDVHVRTPLNDPRSPFKPLAYTSFEPEKQAQIRLEIGSNGPSGIRRMVDRFQKGQCAAVEQQQKQNELNNNSNNDEDEDDELEQQQRQQRTPKMAPIMRQNSLQTLPPASPSIQIVEEEQRSVAEILSKFQQRDFVHPNGTERKDKKEVPPVLRPTNLSRGGSGASIWATSSVRNTQPARDPAPGSLAAIRKSLGSLPTTPTSVGSVSPTPGGAERNASPTNNIGTTPAMPSPQRVPSMPKTVSEFYRMWGAAQAATAAAGGGTQTSIANGSPFVTMSGNAAAADRVTKC
ncbi:hypothetical protein niasHS_007984 [Heterodera schachtii]|uniref:Uncharacterized protein n=1 Tax=Heterodera schachtii TaxID=97005 RepID=A0ABD2JQ61_HETSC